MQEYYDEESITDAYRSTVEQLLRTLLDAEDKEREDHKPSRVAAIPEPTPGLVINEDTEENGVAEEEEAEVEAEAEAEAEVDAEEEEEEEEGDEEEEEDSEDVSSHSLCPT